MAASWISPSMRKSPSTCRNGRDGATGRVAAVVLQVFEVLVGGLARAAAISETSTGWWLGEQADGGLLEESNPSTPHQQATWKQAVAGQATRWA
jgi:hypothetical protein